MPTYYIVGEMLHFFFNDTATTEIYTLSLHDALPICRRTTPNPSRPGIITSSTSRSGRNCSATASACCPSEAVATSKPANRRLAESSSRMFGSSSTTSSRASGFEPDAEGPVLLPDTRPPVGLCAAVVVMVTGCGGVLREAWTLPVRSLGRSAGRGHRPAAAPVADRVVL